MRSKNFELGDWIFEINRYGVEKSTSLLAELVCIFTSPINDFQEKFEKVDPESSIKEHIGKIVGSIDMLFKGYLKPSEIPAFLKNVLAEVRCKKKSLSGNFQDLLPIYQEVFSGRILDQFVLAKEVLYFNYENEADRFFHFLLGFFGMTEEVKKSQNTSTQEVKIKAK